MASYRITFKPSAEKDLRSLPKTMIARVFKRIEALKNNPFPRQSTKLEGSEGLFRIRIGDYRAIYNVDKDQRQIVVHYVRHRSDAYRRL